MFLSFSEERAASFDISFSFIGFPDLFRVDWLGRRGEAEQRGLHGIDAAQKGVARFGRVRKMETMTNCAVTLRLLAIFTLNPRHVSSISDRPLEIPVICWREAGVYLN